MSYSSHSDVEKDTGFEKEIVYDKETDQPHLTEVEEDLIEAGEPPFTERVDPEKDGAALTTVTSKASANNIKSIPNGGVKAWLQVLGVFFVFFNTWGIVNAFGIYQTYYRTGILSSSSPSDISWIGSIESFLLLFVGSIAGPIYDKGYAHELLAVGSILIVLGQMMLSLCTSYYQVLLAQGVSIGIGTGCLFVSGVAILSTYFTTRIATAIGIAASGSSIGGMLYPIIFYKLQPRIGFPWATRVIGFILLGTLLVSNLVLRVRVVPTARRKFFDPGAWKELPYLFFNLGMFFSFFGLYAPFFYVESYAIETGIMGPNLAFYSIVVLNAASTFGRIIPGYLADKFGPLNIVVVCGFAASILQFCLIAAHTTAGVLIIVAFYGFFSGTMVSLPATIFVAITAPQKRGQLGARMGMGFAFVSVGLLAGTPVTGAILPAAGFEAIWLYGGSLLIVGAIFILLTRFAQSKWVLWAKV